MQADKKRLVILISGSGSNLQAFIDHCASGQLQAQIVAVICNKTGAYGLERAAQAGINTHVIEHGDYANRESFDAALARSEEHTSELQSRPHLVCRLLLEKKNQNASASSPQ